MALDYPADPGAAAPRRFGGFELLGRIARGGSSTVYRALQRSPRREVALKLLTDAPDDPRALERLRHEAEAIARLRHPNIVTLYEMDTVEGVPYLAMEYVSGRDLAARLHAGELDRRARLLLLATVADAVQHAHDRGIIHRDLKPANVLVDDEGRAWITDFGLARDHRRPTLTRSGEALGTPAYMAPEQARGERDRVDERTDVWGLGALLYELLCGEPPFTGATPMQTLLRITQDAPVPPRRRDGSVDRDLETICLKCLAADPAERYQTAAEVAAELRRHLAGQAVRARPDGASRRLRRLLRLRRREAFSLAALLVALVAVATGMLRARFDARRIEHAGEIAAAETAFRDAIDAIDAYRHAAAVPLLRRVAAAPDAAFRAERLLEAARRLREQRALLLAEPLTAAALEAVASARLPALEEAAVARRAQVLADLGRFDAARELAQSGRLAAPLARALAPLVGSRLVHLPGPADVLWDVQTGDFDGDGRDEVLASGAGEVVLVRAGDAGLSITAAVIPPREACGARLHALGALDVDGDGKDELVACWSLGPEDGVLCIDLWRGPGTPPVRQFEERFAGGLPVARLAAPLDQQPGNDLVVTTSPGSREVRVYPAPALGAFPVPGRYLEVDPELAATDTDTEAVATLARPDGRGFDLLLGTGGHLGYDVRRYRIGGCAARRIDRVPIGWVQGLLTGDLFAALVSDTPQDPLLVAKLPAPDVAGVWSLRLDADRLAAPKVLHPLAALLGGVPRENAQLNGGARLRGSSTVLVTVASPCRFARHGMESETTLALLDALDPAAAPVSIAATPRLAWGDLDGDGDDEVVLARPGCLQLCGLAAIAESADPTEALIWPPRLLHWNQALAALWRGDPDPTAQAWLMLTGHGSGATGPSPPELAADELFAQGRFAAAAILAARLTGDGGISVLGPVTRAELLRVAGFLSRPRGAAPAGTCLVENDVGGRVTANAARGWEGDCAAITLGDERAGRSVVDLPDWAKAKALHLVVDFCPLTLPYGAAIEVGLFGDQEDGHTIRLGHYRAVRRPSRSRYLVSARQQSPEVIPTVDAARGFAPGLWLRAEVSIVPAVGLAFYSVRGREWPLDEDPLYAAVDVGPLAPGGSAAGIRMVALDGLPAAEVLVDRVRVEVLER